MSNETKLILLQQLVSTLSMTGLIWFVQIAHYPLFAAVGRDQFPAYEAQHGVRTTCVVAPLMLIEAGTSLLLFRVSPTKIPWEASALGAALVFVIWVSTAFVQVPQHELLKKGFDARVWKRLVITNWIRTVAWTCRTLLLACVVWSLLD